MQRDGKQLTLTSRLAVDPRPQGSYLGVSPAVVFQRPGPAGAPSPTRAASSARSWPGRPGWSASLPKAVPDLFAKNRGQTARAARSPAWSAPADITGQVVAAPIGWQARVAVVMLIVASLNIFVGAFNLLPLLPLDGGHLAVVIYERCRAWLARLRGKPDPGPVDFRRFVPVSVGVFALLVGFGLLLIMADLVNPVHIIQ